MKQHAKHNAITAAELDELIRRYFDAETDEADERRLRVYLATSGISTPAADEARAVMGIFAARRAQSRRGLLRRRIIRISAAAAIAGLLAVTASLVITSRTGRPSASDDTLAAWHNGTRCDSPDQVLAMMDSNLALMGEASAEFEDAVSDDLADLGSMLGE